MKKNRFFVLRLLGAQKEFGTQIGRADQAYFPDMDLWKSYVDFQDFGLISFKNIKILAYLLN